MAGMGGGASEEIAEAQKRGDPDLGTTYYHHWLRALERMVLEKGLVLPGEMGEAGRVLCWATAQPRILPPVGWAVAQQSVR